jgi:hypothetical protein
MEALIAFGLVFIGVVLFGGLLVLHNGLTAIRREITAAVKQFLANIKLTVRPPATWQDIAKEAATRSSNWTVATGVGVVSDALDKVAEATAPKPVKEVSVPAASTTRKRPPKKKPAKERKR